MLLWDHSLMVPAVVCYFHLFLLPLCPREEMIVALYQIQHQVPLHSETGHSFSPPALLSQPLFVRHLFLSHLWLYFLSRCLLQLSQVVEHLAFSSSSYEEGASSSRELVLVQKPRQNRRHQKQRKHIQTNFDHRLQHYSSSAHVQMPK